MCRMPLSSPRHLPTPAVYSLKNSSGLSLRDFTGVLLQAAAAHVTQACGSGHRGLNGRWLFRSRFADGVRTTVCRQVGLDCADQYVLCTHPVARASHRSVQCNTGFADPTREFPLLCSLFSIHLTCSPNLSTFRSEFFH